MRYRQPITFFIVLQLIGGQLISVQLAAARLTSDKGAVDVHLYLPAVAQSGHNLPLKVVITHLGQDGGDDIYGTYARGYVINTGSEPLYDVNVAIQMTTYEDNTGLPPPGQITIYTTTALVRTTFTATLPGQPNPFVYGSYNSHTRNTVFNTVQIQSARRKTPNDFTFVAIDTSQWITSTYSLTGTVRNISQMPVHSAQVIVVTNIGYCWLREAPLLTTTLQPNEETGYSLNNCYFVTPNPIGQGIVSP